MFNAYINDFLLEKKVSQGVSDSTINIYYTVFRLFSKSDCINSCDLNTYTKQNFKRFLGDNFLKKKWSSATYNLYRKYLRVYCGFLVLEGFLEYNPIIDIPKRIEPKRLPKGLNKDEVDEIIKNLDNAFDKNTFVGYRNQVIVYTFLYSGLRLKELTNLDIYDINLYDGYIRVVKGKGDKERYVPITKDLTKILSEYLKIRGKNHFHDGEGFLFPTIYGNCLKKRDMRKMINNLRYCLTFHFTWHQLRHTFATELVKHNFDIYNISRILGHSKIDTTKIYLNSNTDELKKQLDKIDLYGKKMIASKKKYK